MTKPFNSFIRPVDAYEIGLRIHDRRVSLSMTQQDLAERIGCSPTHINRVESGRQPSLPLLYAICQVLDLGLDEVMGLKSNADPVSLQILNAVNRFSSAEKAFSIKILSDFEDFFHEMHKRSTYNRYSKRQKSYKPAEDAVPFWQVAEVDYDWEMEDEDDIVDPAFDKKPAGKKKAASDRSVGNDLDS